LENISHKIRSNPNITFALVTFCRSGKEHKNRQQTHTGTGFTAQIRKLPKNEKSYHLVTFRHKKSVFGIFQDSGENTQQKSNGVDKSESKKNENYVTFPRVTWHLHVTCDV